MLRLVIYILFWLSFIAWADDSGSEVRASEPNNNPQTNIRWAAHVGSSYHIPIDHAGQNWQQYVTTGLRLEFPLEITEMLIQFSAEVGNLDMKDRTIENVKILHSSLALVYDIAIISKQHIIRPRLGLTNTVISLKPNLGMKEFAKELLHPTINFESEFGMLLGLEYVMRLRRFQLTLPVFSEVMFSAPHLFISVNISLFAGVVF